jgi:uncharacterized NAD(P)/FAD-binding protein YdhS
MKHTDIAIIGGGFSGMMVAAHLVKRSHTPLHFTLFEKAEFLGKGLAYSTTEPTHLLNVPAGKMSAFPDEPAHFLHWLESAREMWQFLHPTFAHAHYDAHSFVPRMIYAAYLHDIWQHTQQLATAKGHTLLWHDAHVTRITEAQHLHSSDGQICHARSIILTTGHPATRHPSHDFTTPPTGYLPVLWGKVADTYWQWVDNTAWNHTSHAVILGTGLSSVDAFLSLMHHGFNGSISMISRAGALPASHETYEALPTPALDTLPHTAQGLYHSLIATMDKAQTHGGNWRAVIDSLRPLTNDIWQRLPLPEQQQFLTHYLSWWNVRRHRMPPSSYTTMLQTMENKHLTIYAGNISTVRHDGMRFVVSLTGEKPQRLEADIVINALGFDYRLAHNTHPLLQQLITGNMLTPHPLGIGVQTDGDYRAHTTLPLYVIGPLLFGERLESTAVPELRQQAHACAERVLKTLPS